MDGMGTGCLIGIYTYDFFLESQHMYIYISG